MSIRKRTWQPKKGKAKECWIVTYTDLNGTRRQKSFDLKKQAEEFDFKVKSEVKLGTHVVDSDSITVEEAGEQWLKDCEAGHGLERSTLNAYRGHLKHHIVPYIGNIKLTKLSVQMVMRWQQELLDDGRSRNMVRRVTIDLGAILAVAQVANQVGRNVVYEIGNSKRAMRKIRTEKRHRRKIAYGIDFPTVEEVDALLRTVTKIRDKAFLLVATFAGLRSSELRGLRWSDVNFSEGTIRVYQRADAWNVLDVPKSFSGQRTVPVPPIVITTLKEWKLGCPNGSRDLVFPTSNGRVTSHANNIKRILHPAWVAAGVVVWKDVVDKDGNPVLGDDGRPERVMRPKYTGLHSLRHFFASWCINRESRGGRELPALEVQYLMGHESIKQTMDTYSHLFPGKDESESLREASFKLLPGLFAT